MNHPRIALLAAVFVACSTGHQRNSSIDSATEAASAEPTSATIAIDGSFTDWQQVLLNPLQVTRDGTGLTGVGCFASNPDRDCEGLTLQADLRTVAWSADATTVSFFVERPSSNTTLTYSFAFDLDADGLAEATDRVLQVVWTSAGRAVAVKLFAYAPLAPGGDPLGCPGAAQCLPNGAVGFADGFDLPGAIGAELWRPNLSANCNATPLANDEQCGGDGVGARFEASVPWTQLGVAAGSPVLWRVASSTGANFATADDNAGGPDGRAGTLGTFGVDLTIDGQAAAASPGSADHCHQAQNIGDFADRYSLSAVSSAGLAVTWFRSTTSCAAAFASGAIAIDANGDGDFLDVGDVVNVGADTNADLLPDTDLIAAGGIVHLGVRLNAPSGVTGATDRTTLTARSVARPSDVFDGAVDLTRVGPVAVLPDLSRAALAGGAVDLGPFTTINRQPGADTFNLFVRSAIGLQVDLYSDVANAPGALLGTDTNGDGLWDGTVPTTGPLASGASATFWLRLHVTAPTPIGANDVVRLTATSQAAPTATASAESNVRVSNGLTLEPSHAGAPGQFFGAAGTSVYLPHRLTNALNVANTVTLSQSGSLAAGWAARFWSDPNGDGNIADGAPIVGTINLAANGGSAHIVTELVIPPAALQGDLSLAATTATGLPGSLATAADHVAVGPFAAYADANLTLATRAFPSCAAIRARASGLGALTTTTYQLHVIDPLANTLQSDNFATDSEGSGSGAFAQTAGGPVGNFRLRVFQGAGTPLATHDLDPVLVERSGNVVVNVASAAVDGPVSVSARLTSLATKSAYPGTTVQFELRDPSAALLATSTVAALDVPFLGSALAYSLFPNVTFTTFGNHSVQATWRAACGGTIAQSSSTLTRRPPAPTLTSPGNNTSVGTATPQLAGTAVAGSTVDLIVDGAPAGSGTGPTFTVTSAALAPGAHTWSATQTVNGVTSSSSPTFTFTVDTTAPAAPVVTVPASGSASNNRTPTISGTAEANGSVAVFVDSNLLATVTADVAGNWTYTLTGPQALADGSHAATARTTDQAGNQGPISAARTFFVDNAAPLAPQFATPANNARINDTTPTFTGTAEANLTVQVLLMGSGLGSTTADATGNWSFTVGAGQDLAEGGYTVTARAVDAAGNTSPQSPGHNFVIDFSAPSAPVVTIPTNGALVSDTTPTISGTSEAGATVAVTVDGATLVGTAPTDSTGFWSYALTAVQALADGSHTASAVATDQAGNASVRSATINFVVDSVAPAAPVMLTPVDNGRTGPTPTLTGTAPLDSIIQLAVDGILVAAVTPDAQGNFRYTLSTAQRLAGGAHAVSAIASDAAGNNSQRSNENAFSVDATAPGSPVITSPTEGSNTGASPAINGSAEAGATVEVFVDNRSAGSSTVDAQGNWNLTPPFALADGAHTVGASATDTHGNVSVRSALINFTVGDGGTGGGAGGGGQPPIYSFGGGGCACSGSGASVSLYLGLLALFGLRRRRASR